MKRKLVIDGQIFQTPAWNRGMGKYSIELVAQLGQAGHRERWEAVEVILSSRLPRSADMLDELRRKAGNVIITELNLQPNTDSNASIVAHNRQVVDRHVGKDEGEVDYLILSLMQGEIYPVFPALPGVRKLLLFYDLIPLMLPGAYLTDPVARAKYLAKFPELLKADKYLAISKTAANDLALQLGIDSERIVSIDGGPIRHAAAGKQLDVPRPFILMPTGNDTRKNNTRGIEAFEKFNREAGGKYHLVVTSSFDEAEVSRLKALSGNAVFTGNVSGEELEYLYEQAEGLFFPSEYEGLGLPILEAVEKDKPVACSDISVFREIAETGFHYFDPRSVLDMTRALKSMIEDPEPDAAAYRKITENYTWANTAAKFREAAASVSTAKKQRPKKIAAFGPGTPVVPAGENILLGHAELGRRCGVDYYLNSLDQRPADRVNFLPYVTGTFAVGPGLGFDASAYDGLCYFLGNGPDFATALFAALAMPGTAVLYDLNLDDTWAQLAERKLAGRSRMLLEKQLDKDYGHKGLKLLVSLVASQKSIVVFSESAKATVEAIAKNLGTDTKVYSAKRPSAAPVYKIASSAQPGQDSYKQFAETLLAAMGVARV